jgi:hypothetical protein
MKVKVLLILRTAGVLIISPEADYFGNLFLNIVLCINNTSLTDNILSAEPFLSTNRALSSGSLQYVSTSENYLHGIFSKFTTTSCK